MATMASEKRTVSLVRRGLVSYSSHTPRCNAGVEDRFLSASGKRMPNFINSSQAFIRRSFTSSFTIQSNRATRYGGWKGSNERIIGGVGMRKRPFSVAVGRLRVTMPGYNFFTFFLTIFPLVGASIKCAGYFVEVKVSVANKQD